MRVTHGTRRMRVIPGHAERSVEIWAKRWIDLKEGA